jgi:hypothetical protein
MNDFNPRKPKEFDWGSQPTPPLDAVVQALKADDNLWWVMGSGHHQNLFDAALERLEPAEGLVNSVKAFRDELTREGHHPERGPVNIETRRITNRLNKIIHKWRQG